ncbi:hypothetical protein Plhal304r1_c028g0093371 [Plasmopara halstedii]
MKTFFKPRIGFVIWISVRAQVLGMSIEAARGGDYFYRLTGSVPTWLNAEAAPFSVGDDESRY